MHAPFRAPRRGGVVQAGGARGGLPLVALTLPGRIDASLEMRGHGRITAE